MRGLTGLAEDIMNMVLEMVDILITNPAITIDQLIEEKKVPESAQGEFRGILEAAMLRREGGRTALTSVVIHLN